MRSFLALLFVAATAVQAQDPDQVLRNAMHEAQARRAAILVDFHAPWCYSCYYMAQHVLSGPEWEQLQRKLVVLSLDADAPEGRYWMEAWGVRALPSYLVLTAQAEEVGRILGEQTRADFYARIAALTDRTDTLEALMHKVQDDSPASVAAAREVLQAFHARYDAAGGLDWFLRLPPAWRAQITRDREAALGIARLELMRARDEQDIGACLKAGQAVLAGALGCERPYELARVLDCSESLPDERRRAVLGPQVAAMEGLLERQVFGDGPRCADERSVVLKAADLHTALGEPRRATKLLQRAADDVEDRLGRDVSRDRNLADNLRVYLERAGKHRDLDRLYRRLLAAYPEDHVYSFRFARSLAGRDRHEEALPLFALAMRKAYGVNRLHVAGAWARSYEALGRALDAQLVVAQALQGARAWFPREAAELRKLQEQLAAAAAKTAANP